LLLAAAAAGAGEALDVLEVLDELLLAAGVVLLEAVALELEDAPESELLAPSFLVEL
jgi:hypothetical protein